MSDQSATQYGVARKILGAAHELSRHLGEEKVDDRHLLVAILHAEPDLAEVVFKEVGIPPAVAARLLRNSMLLLADGGGDMSGVEISAEATAALQACVGTEVDGRKLMEAILTNPGANLHKALERLTSPPEMGQAIGPYLTNRDYLEEVIEFWRKREEIDSTPVLVRQAMQGVTEFARRMTVRRSLSSPERLLPLRLRQRHRLTMMEGELLDLAMARECFGEPWISTVRKMAETMGPAGYPRRLGCVLAAATRLEFLQLINRDSLSDELPWRVTHGFDLHPGAAQALLAALADDPISEREVGSAEEDLAGLL